MVDVLAASVPQDDLGVADHTSVRQNLDTALAVENSLATEARVMSSRLSDLKSQVAIWVEDKVNRIEGYDHRVSADQANLDLVFHQRRDEHTALCDASEDLLSEERNNLTETVKDLETLGAKLEYELTALSSKVEDVENGVAEFERQVVMVEGRAEELQREERDGSGSWPGWVWRKSMMRVGVF